MAIHARVVLLDMIGVREIDGESAGLLLRIGERGRVASSWQLRRALPWIMPGLSSRVQSACPAARYGEIVVVWLLWLFMLIPIIFIPSTLLTP